MERPGVHGGPADPEEAAALVAAVEQFLRDTAPPPPPPRRGSPWRRAALLEGIGAAERPASWGDAQPWGRSRSR